MPTRATIYRVEGDTNPITVEYQDGSGDAVDITGYTFTMYGRHSDGTQWSASGTITSAVGGTVEFSPGASLTVGTHEVEILVTDASGDDDTVPPDITLNVQVRGNLQ